MAVFDSVLIANRGEIAVRIVRTLRRMGIRSIAVYSDADADARHVVEADEAQRLGPTPAAESYLDVDRVVRAAERAGAQALHPGYGFLSEHTGLADACAKAGIVFVGPPPAAIEAMGDKIRAKAMVAANGVPTVPGLDSTGLPDAELAARAATLGYPILIKPSAGGGGKGMRLVTAADELREALISSRREARGAFGDDTLLLERFIDRPRHIEVQVLADAHGNIVHLGERECSLQRRHQKVVEEAPSPLLTDADRDAIGAQAIAAARACGYVNAGTVEFIVSGDRPGKPYFMEMNTRLQVEHPVTEMVWGLDLVEWQLRIAAGEPLGFAQADLAPQGHAIEARVYAEDPTHGFLPTGGRVLRLEEPTDVPNVRVDSSLRVGGEVGSSYDPMLSKVIAWGVDRSSALHTLDAALAHTNVLGLTTNIGFLRDLLHDDDVVAGTLDTGLIERRTEGRARPAPPLDAVIAAALTATDLPAGAPAGPWADRTAWRLGGPAWFRWTAAELGGHRLTAELRSDEHDERRVDVRRGEEEAEVVVELDAGSARIVRDGTATTYATAHAGTVTWVGAGGRAWGFDSAVDHGAGAGSGPAGDGVISSPMPGSVIAVPAPAGTQVTAGQPVVVVEAMKMEHTLRAEVAGTVREVFVRVGQQVALGERLAVVEPEAAPRED
jgi:acetyl-CoA/propionyl-CoA carboxylase biotin carboxyl carrier protein